MPQRLLTLSLNLLSNTAQTTRGILRPKNSVVPSIFSKRIAVTYNTGTHSQFRIYSQLVHVSFFFKFTRAEISIGVYTVTRKFYNFYHVGKVPVIELTYPGLQYTLIFEVYVYTVCQILLIICRTIRRRHFLPDLRRGKFF
jgi:hypothetical protein